ncbi:hypothetical protein L3X38_042289 [Prunus dulcis]|uniref:Uncharacterized protein n=1 Tax=Prunus dulcis TaxID=3755 RepID=A0AAD4UUK4_PRUDU|nr:hypothetical protein L3X38_042289 [Prunus dulcis]
MDFLWSFLNGVAAYLPRIRLAWCPPQKATTSLKWSQRTFPETGTTQAQAQAQQQGTRCVRDFFIMGFCREWAPLGTVPRVTACACEDNKADPLATSGWGPHSVLWNGGGDRHCGVNISVSQRFPRFATLSPSFNWRSPCTDKSRVEGE